MCVGIDRSTLDYFLEDVVEMLDFVPPPSDKKKRKEDIVVDEDGEKEVRLYMTTLPYSVTLQHFSCKTLRLKFLLLVSYCSIVAYCMG